MCTLCRQARQAAAVFLLGAVVAVVLSGCWSRREIELLAMVQTMGVDVAPEGVRLSIQLPEIRPAAGGGASGIATAAVVGRNIDDAAHQLLLRFGRFITWNHLQAVVVSADYARGGLTELLDFLMRLPEVKETARLLVARGSAGELLRAKVPGEPRPAAGLRELLAHGRREGMTAWVETVSFSAWLLEPGIDPVAPVVEVGPNGAQVAAGAAVFRGDRLVGFLDEADTRGLMAVRQQGRHLELPTRCPDGGEQAFLRGESRTNRVEPVLAARRVRGYRIRVGVNARPTILPCRGKLTDIGQVAKIEQVAAADLRRDVLGALGRARELDTDILGLGQVAYRRGTLPADLDAWQRVPVEVEAQVVLLEEGTQLEVPKEGLTR